MFTLPETFVWPDYEGGSIANVPATIAALLNAPFTGLPPLRSPLWQSAAGDVQRVVLLVLDGFGSNLVERNEAYLSPWRQRAVAAAQLTSVFPSTTVAALSSLWTGYAPAQHGLVGLTMLFPQYGALGQMLGLSPIFQSPPNMLVRAGLEPEQFLQTPGFAQQLAAAGIPTHAFKGAHIVDSALSRMHGRGVAGNHGIYTFAELMVRLRDLLEHTAGQRLYINAYWPHVDTLSHYYSPFHDAVDAEIRAIFAQLERELWQTLSPAARAGTLLCIVADHGQLPTPYSLGIHLRRYPELEQMLLMHFAGEARTAYLYARQGQQAELLAYLQQKMSQMVWAMPAATILQQGLWGPPPYAADVPRRLGDVVAVMRGGHAFISPLQLEREKKFIGRHGGLSAAEMHVPWWVFRLDQA